MFASRPQRTLSRPATVSGFGYFSGQDVRVEFRPAPEGAGITFVRRDVSPHVRVPAWAALRIDMPRRTTLQIGGVRVEMVEHILAALHGLSIDNCEVWVDAAEMPGCDGSALAYVEAIDVAGVAEQRSPARRIVVDRPIRVGTSEKWIEARPRTGRGLAVSFELDYGPTTAIGRQTFALEVTPDSFRRELAPCRTFIQEEAAKAMAARGLGKRVTPQDLLIFGPQGLIDNELRFPDECVRHKVLDVVGDLALTGCEIIGQVTAHRSGHQIHAELAKILLHRQAERDRAGQPLPEENRTDQEPIGALAGRRCA